MKKEISAKIAAFVFLLVVTVLMIFLNDFKYLEKPKNFIVYIMSPLQKTFQSSANKVSDFFYTLDNIGKFKKENVALKTENLQLNYEMSEMKEIERENELLKKQLEFSEEMCNKKNCLNWKMGNIISRDPDNYGKYIFIDLGGKNNVEKGQPVVVSGGIFIGKIIEVFDSSSKVILVTSPESSVNSITQTTRANGVVDGKYATGAKLEMINQNEQLINGDLIITSGLEEKIPKGLLIGKVSNIKESANKIFKEADVNLFADLNHIEEIFIASKYGK